MVIKTSITHQGKNRGRGIFRTMRIVGIVLLCVFSTTQTQAQQSVNAIAKDVLQRFSGLSGNSGSDTTSPRPKNEDSIEVRTRTLRQTTLHGLDSGVLELNSDVAEFPLYVHLGNILTATKPIYFDIERSINFRTNTTPFEKYFWHPDDIPFFQEDKPLTKLGYSTGGTDEQHFFARHSRNLNTRWNVAAGFRLTSSEGKYKNQKTNISNGSVNSNYVSKNERLRVQGAWTSNQADLQENGGIDLKDPIDIEAALLERAYNNRYYLPVKLGQAAPSKRNVYIDFVNTGRILSEQHIEGNISYDLGRMDEDVSYKRIALDADTKKLIKGMNDDNSEDIIKNLEKRGINFEDIDTTKGKISDSVTATLTARSFTPRFRVSLGYQYGSINHLFKDEYYDSTNYAKTSGYDTLSFREFAVGYNDTSKTKVTSIRIQDAIIWHKATAGLLFFLQSGRTDRYLQAYSTLQYYDVNGRSKFQDYDWTVGGVLKIGLWKENIQADIRGEVTVAGWHQGDNYIDGKFAMYVPTIKSKLSFGLYQSFRSAAFHFTQQSNFFLQPTTQAQTWEKEYTLHPFVALEVDFLKTKFQFNNFVFNNFFYFDNNYTPKQFKDVVTINQFYMYNHFTFLKHFNYTSDLWFQTTSQPETFAIPSWITQQRLFIAGKVMGKQDIALGIEALIVPSFQPQGFAPIVTDWIYQSTQTKPTTYTLNAFVHFRLRGLFFYLRFQNLNTASVNYNNGSFSYPEVNNASFILGNYYPGFNIKFGFYWNLIN